MGLTCYFADFRRGLSLRFQVSGTKRWSLKPPPECYWKCPGEVSVTLDPGDIIVVNTNWWSHSTKVLGAAVSVTITNEYEM